MTDLKARFAELDDVPVPDLMERVEAALDALDAAPTPLRKPGPPAISAVRPRRQRALATMLAVFVGTLVIIGGLVWLVGIRDDNLAPVDSDEPLPTTTLVPQPTSPPDAPTPETGSTLPPTTVPDASSVDGVGEPAWRRVADPAVFGPLGGEGSGGEEGGEIAIDHVIAGPKGLVAVGTVLTELNDRLVIWTSTDGTNWDRLPWDAEVFGGAQVSDLAVGGPGLLAVGAVTREDQRINGTIGPYADGEAPFNRRWAPRDAAIWSSLDGRTWTRVPHNDDLFGSARIEGIAVVGQRLVAVGEVARLSVRPDDPVFLCDGVPVDRGGVECTPQQAVWTSNDGLTWEKSASDLQIDKLGGTTDQFIAIGRGPGSTCETTFTAEFYLFESRCAGPLAAWHSTDGTTWTLSDEIEGIFVPPDGGTYTETLDLAVSESNAMVIFIRNGPGEDTWGRGMWASRDEGQTWVNVPEPTSLDWLVPTPAGFIAGARSQVFTSEEGLAWEKLPLPTESTDWLMDAAGAQGQLTVVGTADGYSALVLIGPSP